MIKKNAPKKKSNRSLFYRISAWLHLWLGLVTGIIVIIVCLTGCIWCFNEEITDLLDSHSKIVVRDAAIMKPSQINQMVQQRYTGYTLQSYSMREGKAILAYLSPTKELKAKDSTLGSIEVKIDPYIGTVLSETKYKKGETKFFRWILNGHRFLWLPYKVGRPIINYSILIFVITLITGLVLWWPKKWNKSTRDRCFKIKWNGTVKRINYDLHNVFGFYTMVFLLIIAMTGMVYGIEWFSKSSYWLTTGGKNNMEYVRLSSDSIGKITYANRGSFGLDSLWNVTSKGNGNSTGFYITLPDTSNSSGTIYMTFYPSKGKFYDNKNYVFDQYSFKRLEQKSIYGKPYDQCSPGEKIRKMNYDLHVGSILGLPGKFLAFSSSLFGASLPITGFII